MKSRIFLPFIWLSIFVLLVGLACNAASGAAEDPTLPPQPTQPPPPTNPPPTDPPPPTEPPPSLPTNTPRPPKPTAQPEAPPATGGLSLSSELYVHPFGIYEFFPIDGWDFTSEDDGSIWLEAPDFSGAIYFEVTNTGYTLDPDAFGWFVTAREENVFNTYDDYFEVGREDDLENGLSSVEKQLSFDGVPQTVVSIYDQHGSAVYVLDFWANDDLYNAYDPGYDAFFNGITVYADEVAFQTVYRWRQAFYGPDDLFYIEVPEAWFYESTYEDIVAVDTFYSPDDFAIVENVAYDDGETVSKSDAGAFALELLREFYAEDIRITDDQVQPDGSERLIWNSPSGNYTGWSFFETRGTTFLLFTLYYTNDYEDAYFDVLNEIVDTYDIP